MNAPWQTPPIIAHCATLARSYHHFTGAHLVDDCVEPAHLAEKLFHAPFVLISHDTGADPILNYGNATALALWETTWEDLTCTPSRHTAEAPLRDERAKLLAMVTTHGYIDDYSGVRISKCGRRFRITQATVWNLIDDLGKPCGQAAKFNHWEYL